MKFEGSFGNGWVCFPGNFKKTGKGNWGEENQIRGVLKRANEAITSLKGPR